MYILSPRISNGLYSFLHLLQILVVFLQRRSNMYILSPRCRLPLLSITILGTENIFHHNPKKTSAAASIRRRQNIPAKNQNISNIIKSEDAKIYLPSKIYQTRSRICQNITAIKYQNISNILKSENAKIYLPSKIRIYQIS